MLERELTRRQAVQPGLPEHASPEDEEVNRALERSLVREGGLLLSAKTVELEPNFVYSHTTVDDFRRDAFGPGLTLRSGLPWRSQLEVALPYVFEYRRSGGVTARAGGVGDLYIAVSHQFVAERPLLPGMIGGLGYQVSTGRNTIFESATPAALGSGFDTIQAFLTAIKRVDPLVFFGTYTFAHNFADTKAGVEVEPGNSSLLALGIILATGPSTSLRIASSLTFFDTTKYGGIPLTGTDEPYALLEFGGAVVLSESTALDVAVGAGMTRSAPDFRIRIALPIRF